MLSDLVHAQVHEVVVLLADLVDRVADGDHGRQQRDRDEPRLQEIFHRGRSQAAAGESPAVTALRARPARPPRRRPRRAPRAGSAEPRTSRAPDRPAAPRGCSGRRRAAAPRSRRARGRSTASAKIRRGRPGTSSRTTSAEAAVAGRTPRVWLSTSSDAEHERAGGPEPGEDLAALLLRERHAGPEPEQEVARLPVHVAERVAQAAAEEERLDVAVEHAQHDVAGDEDHTDRGEDQRQPALELGAHQQQQRREHRRVERPAPGGDERLVGRLGPARRQPGPEPQAREARRPRAAAAAAAWRRSPRRPPRATAATPIVIGPQTVRS